MIVLRSAARTITEGDVEKHGDDELGRYNTYSSKDYNSAGSVYDPPKLAEGQEIVCWQALRGIAIQFRSGSESCSLTASGAFVGT